MEPTNFPNMGPDQSFVRFGSGTLNNLYLKNSNVVESYTKNGYAGSSSLSKTALIHIGGGLSINGDGSLVMSRQIGGARGAFIGTDADEASSANLVINSGTLKGSSTEGAAIGSGNGGSMGDITINGGTIYVSNAFGTGIGTGVSGSVGNITVHGGNITSQVWQEGNAGIGGGRDKTSVGNIDLSGGKVYATSQRSSLYNAPAVGPGNGGSVGSIYAPGVFSIVKSMNTYRQDLPDVALNPAESTILFGDPLVIHHGTKANQALHVYISSMHTDALGIDTASVVTRQEATSALSQIDEAIEYALDNATRVGAYSQQLAFTQANLVTANENTEASESVIRDADMAQEMMHYARENVLAQAAQSMLGQANQAGSSVLSLLQ